ncbi:hypothetical protein Dsin_031206 [Dipteronia sinensis]|uniref:Uncharacterized protein n=1 Tax=Dipteronia sinensis TaxID=43782 RepID=A0AAE0DT59_9ROSI|nr:hypothetical protein Dsin_031206 [Dipteronia sinensis]
MEVAKSTPPSPPPPTTPQTQALGIKNNNCFRCDKQGHWARDCPNKSQPTATGAAVNSLQNPTIQCPCGGGACVIHVSRTEKNPNRKFYACPLPVAKSTPPSPPPPTTAQTQAPGIKNNNCFRCDKQGHWARDCPNKSQPTATGAAVNGLQNPTIQCPSGGGACVIHVSKTEKNPNRKFYACPVPGFGACKFIQWENTGENTRVGEHVDESKDYGSSQSTCDSHSSLGWSETMEIEVPEAENPQGFPSLVSMPISSAEDDTQLMEGRIYDQTSDISSPNHHDSSPCGAPENGSPTLESTIGDLVMQEAESLNPMTKKRSQGISLISQNEVHCRQIEFWMQISAAEDISTGDIMYQILGLHVLGWLGRLVFPPPRSLKDHPPKPFFCGIFPGFDPIFVPEDGNMLNVECDKLSSPTPRADRRQWNVSSEISVVVVSGVQWWVWAFGGLDYGIGFEGGGCGCSGLVWWPWSEVDFDLEVIYIYAECIFPSLDPIFVPQNGNRLDLEGSTPELDKLSSPTPGGDRQQWNGVLWKPSGLKRSFAIIQSDILVSPVVGHGPNIRQTNVTYGVRLSIGFLSFVNYQISFRLIINIPKCPPKPGSSGMSIHNTLVDNGFKIPYIGAANLMEAVIYARKIAKYGDAILYRVLVVQALTNSEILST